MLITNANSLDSKTEKQLRKTKQILTDDNGHNVVDISHSNKPDDDDAILWQFYGSVGDFILAIASERV